MKISSTHVITVEMKTEDGRLEAELTDGNLLTVRQLRNGKWFSIFDVRVEELMELLHTLGRE